MLPLAIQQKTQHQTEWDELMSTSQSRPANGINTVGACIVKELALQPLDTTCEPLVRSVSIVSDFARALCTLDNAEIASPYIDKARELVSWSHYGKASQLSNSGYLLARKFERFGNLDDLEEAILLTENALDITPAHHPDRAARLNNLGNWLGVQFEQTGAMDHLKRAISKSEEAVQTTPHNHPSRAKRLSSLAHWLARRHERTGSWQDLEQAILFVEQAVNLTEFDHPDRPAYLASLSNMMALKYQQTHNSIDLKLAIFLVKGAVMSSSTSSPDRKNWLCNLGTILAWKYEQTGSFADLKDAIHHTREALGEMPHDHPNRASSLISLGDLLRCWYNRMQPMKGYGCQGEYIRRDCLSCYVEGWNCISAPLFVRIRAAYKAAEVLSSLQEWDESSTLLNQAIRMLLTNGLYNLSPQDQQYMLKEFAGLATLAASASLLGRKGPVQALQLLELGRGVIARLRFCTKSNTGIAMVEQRIPNFGRKLEYLRNHDISSRLSVSPSHDMAYSPDIREKGGKHGFSFIQSEGYINGPRQCAGFGDFPLPTAEAQLRAAAYGGPIVVINISPVHSAALIVETNAIRWLTLHDISQNDVILKAEALKSIHSSREACLGERIAMMSQILEWLWDVVANPILEELGFSEPPAGDEWPRMWWIPTGLLSVFPLHAAGYHRTTRSETVIDRVVSSYSPSIQALLHAQNQPINIDFASENILLVAMEKTPKCSRLGRARDEIDVVKRLTPASAVKSRLENACKEEVVDELRHCGVFHFAGHSLPDPSDPSKSRLALRDWQENPLTAEDLINMNRHGRHRFLAYLSACSTGASLAERLHDESLNLMTACQLAGFRHSVGSLWDVYDEYSVDAARQFYSVIGRSETIVDKTVALGVHLAARRIRDVTRMGGYSVHGEDNPLAWAAYIHMGP
ncbi:CHAT domain-containing protein [Biscogniauxia sp. FL1348]|nr:CHAT domain-containing protein [Biscogniauxia sp. FL1348]